MPIYTLSRTLFASLPPYTCHSSTPHLCTFLLSSPHNTSLLPPYFLLVSSPCLHSSLPLCFSSGFFATFLPHFLLLRPSCCLNQPHPRCLHIPCLILPHFNPSASFLLTMLFHLLTLFNSVGLKLPPACLLHPPAPMPCRLPALTFPPVASYYFKDVNK